MIRTWLQPRKIARLQVWLFPLCHVTYLPKKPKRPGYGLYVSQRSCRLSFSDFLPLPHPFLLSSWCCALTRCLSVIGVVDGLRWLACWRYSLGWKTLHTDSSANQWERADGCRGSLRNIFRIDMVGIFVRTFYWTILIFALGRLLIRAYLVIQIPNEVLVDKLGLDVPPSPEITLEEVHSEDVRISWKQQDLYNSLSGYAIHINGSNG